MIEDLVGALNYLKQAHTVTTYKSVLFPAPALESTTCQCNALVSGSENIRLP